ncbi:MAG TPA: DUF4214 domain-containing protein [Pyrinomonadaceae bacterium]
MRHHRNNLRRLAIMTLTLSGLLVFATASHATRTSAPVSAIRTTPGANGRIAYDSNRDGNHEIYTVNPDGSGVARLTIDPAGDFLPVWSPDGTRIAFISTRDGNAEIYLMNADGSNQRRLTNNPAVDEYPTWSPDGKQIAFDSDRDGNYEIYVMNADGGQQTRITNHRADDAIPRWSPDGKRIAFTSDRDGNYEIYTMTPAGIGVSRLTSSPGDDLVASWSPDGSRLAFDTTRDDPNPAGCAVCNHEIYLMNADGSNPNRITDSPGFDGDPAWSPDGKQIAFDSERDGDNKIYVVSAGGGVPVRLNASAGIDELPDWQALPGGDGGTGASVLQFSQASYQVSEGEGRATLTITRTGDTTVAATLSYRTADADTFTVGCADGANNQGGAYARCDFATAVGTLRFAPGETSRQVAVPLIDDGHDEGAETFQLRLGNPTGATLGAPDTAIITIQDNDAAGAPNPVMTSFPFFVRQQYLDFLSREPDTNGFNAWLGVLSTCADANTGPKVSSQCDRIYVSGEGFFRSQEFQLKGFYVFRFYRLAFNRLPEYTEIVSDMSFVAGATAEEVYARKAQLATSITERAEFQTLYAGMTDAQFVETLLGRYGLAQVTTPDPAQPDTGVKVTLASAELANRLRAGTLTRAQVLRAVADSDAVGAREFNNAFVGMQYYGYLRRKPDDEGLRAWLDVLQAGDARTMVDGFLNSVEYKLRFGQP